MRGCWVIVCGPSGAGKDSVIDWARAALGQHPDICFAQRLVTRATDEGTGHQEVSCERLAHLQRRGELAWHWSANGHDYGIPREYALRVAAGTLVVVNGSREHAHGLGARPDVRRVLVTAPTHVLRTRLQQRGREDAHAITGRLGRNAGLSTFFADRVIVNDAALQRAGESLRDYLLQLAR